MQADGWSRWLRPGIKRSQRRGAGLPLLPDPMRLTKLRLRGVLRSRPRWLRTYRLCEDGALVALLALTGQIAVIALVGLIALVALLGPVGLIALVA